MWCVATPESSWQAFFILTLAHDNKGPKSHGRDSECCYVSRCIIACQSQYHFMHRCPCGWHTGLSQGHRSSCGHYLRFLDMPMGTLSRGSIERELSHSITKIVTHSHQNAVNKARDHKLQIKERKVKLLNVNALTM